MDQFVEWINLLSTLLFAVLIVLYVLFLYKIAAVKSNPKKLMLIIVALTALNITLHCADIAINNIASVSAIAILGVYFAYLSRVTGVKSHHKQLLSAFCVTMGLALLFHFAILCRVTDGTFDNWVLRLLFSAKYAFEMFLTKTVFEKGNIAKVLLASPLLYWIYSILYGAAVLTSGFMGFHFLSRRRYTKRWLKRGDADIRTHILVDINDASRCLAKDIKEKNANDQIIFVHIPRPEDGWQGLSLWNNVIRIFKSRKDANGCDKYVVLRGDNGINEGVEKWLVKASTSIYLLSENQSENLAALEKLWKKKDVYNCRIYCHARRDDALVSVYDRYADDRDRVTFIDSSYLAVQLLKRGKDNMLPVHYVKVAKDDDIVLGYVESPFNCAVIGFGETGREAMKFLYEFGAFPDKDNNKSPFKCHIFDNNLDRRVAELGLDISKVQSPEAGEREFKTYSMDIASYSFRATICELIRNLNYVFVCLGDDDLNVATAINLAQCAVENGRDTKDRFCIAVRLSSMSALNKDAIDKANKDYDGCIKEFGNTEDIWKYDIISNEYLDKEARTYYALYKNLSDELDKSRGYAPSPTWEQRETQLRSADTSYKDRCGIRRKREQDYANCLHKNTKRILCGHKPLAGKILTVNDKATHCDNCDASTSAILEHLAVCEHLRWEASHLLMGYRLATGSTDDSQKLHDCLKPYSILKDDATRHYDWLVVKNSLESEKNEASN